MKNLKKMVCIALGIFAMSCSKKEDTVPALSVAFEAINTTVTAIPDGTNATPSIPNSVEIPITIDKEGVIADGNKISIELDLNHTWAGDLAIQVITPSGESCGLVKRIGSNPAKTFGSNNNFIAGNKLVFNSAFVNSIPAVADTNLDIPAGNYKPTFGDNLMPTNVVEVPLATFFANKNIKGIWK